MVHAENMASEDAADAPLKSLLANPFALSVPDRPRVPLIFASPHSGRLYPARFVRQSRLGALSLRRSEDAFVDELFAGALAIGAPLLAARFPRAYLDANRAPTELDPSMFEDALAVPVEPAGPRVAAGLGVIPKIVRDGAEIYGAKIPAREAAERLTRLHRPYHAALGRLVQDTRRQLGVAVLIDCHSMPSLAAAPDIVLGDRYGLSADSLVTRAAERAFAAQGFRVARNVPYAGGYTTQLYGCPARGLHALQVEVNRGLYLSEDRVEPTAGFAALASRIAEALQDLAGLGLLLGAGSGIAHAAE